MIEYENKKIKGAKKQIYNGIVFNSSLELFFYKEAIKEGLIIEYEPEKIVLLDSFKMNKLRHYIPAKDKTIQLSTDIIRAVTYMPDFRIRLGNNVIIWIETKGFKNDAYPIKKKMFLNQLNKGTKQSYFFEPHTQRQCLQVIEIIKTIKEINYNKTINLLYKYCRNNNFNDLLSKIENLSPNLFISKLEHSIKNKKYKDNQQLKSFLSDLKISW